MDRSHRIGRRAFPCVGDATGLVTQKLSADGRGPCYTYTDDGNLATRTWARGVTTSYTYDAWGRLTSTTSSDGTPVSTRPLYWQPRTSQGNFSLFYTHDGNKNVSEAIFYQRARGVAAHDEYAPFGEVTAQTRGNVWGTLDLATDHPWRFSCEYAEEATGMVYYNYRHYEPMSGRWFSRERYDELPALEVYQLDVNDLVLVLGVCRNTYSCNNDFVGSFDLCGLAISSDAKSKSQPKVPFPKFEGINTHIGALQRVVAAEVRLPGEWTKEGMSIDDAKKGVDALLWCLCNRKRMHNLGNWTEVVKEVEGRQEQWKNFSNYPESYRGSRIHNRLKDFQRMAEKGHAGMLGYELYYNFWVYIQNNTKTLDCSKQMSGFESTLVFRNNYDPKCSVCYMRTEGRGNSVANSTVIGTVGGNTFTITNVKK